MNTKKFTMTASLTLPEIGANEALLNYAIKKGYAVEIPTLDIDKDTGKSIRIPNPETALDYLASVKQKELVDDLFIVQSELIEIQRIQTIKVIKEELTQAVKVEIKEA